jgi:hypothetical protein
LWPAFAPVNPSAPASSGWVRLLRRGTTFTAFDSPDGNVAPGDLPGAFSQTGLFTDGTTFGADSLILPSRMGREAPYQKDTGWADALDLVPDATWRTALPADLVDDLVRARLG